MKTQKVRFKNFRNVPDMEQELNGSNIILLAENTRGKSNFIKGILGALGGNFGKNAIRTGADKAEIEVVLADFDADWKAIEGTEYSFLAKIRKKKDGDEEAVLEVTAPNGMRDTKKSVIGSIAGELELDYNFVELSRTKSGKQKQVEIIKSYLDDDTKKLLAVQESRNKKAYDDRTEIGRLLKNVKGFIQEALLNPGDFEKYKEPVDIKPLQIQLENAGKVNQQIQDVKNRMIDRAERVMAISQEMEELKKELSDIAEKNSSANQWLFDHQPVEAEEIRTQLQEAADHNNMCEKVKLFVSKKKEADDYDMQYGELGALYDSGKQSIQDMIRNMDFPIAGISFDEENVYYNDKLVDENNMSTAEIMMLEAQLKMCKAPGAEVLFIQRGESLGLHLLKELQKLAKENGFQIVMEQVERGTEELKIEFMTDLTKESIPA